MNNVPKNSPARPAQAPLPKNRSGLASHYPVPMALVVFGIGLAVGTALGAWLGESAASPPSFTRRTELAAGKLGRKVLGAVAGVLPDSLSKHIAA